MNDLSSSPIKSFGKNFCICGFTGWCIECIWTGLGSFENIRTDRRLVCQTSLWMFPIYGLAAFIPSIYKFIGKKNPLVRGTVYSTAIFTFEFLSGSLLRCLNACPWDYHDSKLNIKGLIRLDYAPFWAITGPLYEKMLCGGLS